MFLLAAPGVKVMFQAPPGVPNVLLVLSVFLMFWSAQEHKNFLLMFLIQRSTQGFMQW